MHNYVCAQTTKCPRKGRGRAKVSKGSLPAGACIVLIVERVCDCSSFVSVHPSEQRPTMAWQNIKAVSVCASVDYG